MKISYSEYIKKANASVLVAEAIFSELQISYEMKEISEVAETVSGGTPARGNSDYYNGDIPWLKSGELNDGLIDRAEEFITESGLLNSSAKRHPRGTLLLAMYGATAGRTGITTIEAATNQAICALFPTKFVNRNFLFWFLRQHRYRFIEVSRGGAQPNISQAVIKKIRLPIPPMELQIQISALLERIEEEKALDLDLIPQQFQDKVKKVFYAKSSVLSIGSELTHQLYLVKQLRQAFLREAMQGKLVPQDPNDEPASELLKRIKAEKEKLIREGKLKKDKPLPPIRPEEIPFEIPKGWVWCRLGEVCTKIGSGSTPLGGDYSSSGLPFFRSQNIHDNGLVFDDIKYISERVHQDMAGTIVLGNDILLNITGGSMGRCALVPSDFVEGNVSQHVCIIRQLHCDPRFIHKVVLSPYFQALIFDSTTGAGREGLPKYNLEKFCLPLAPYSEQQRIVIALEKLMHDCNEFDENINQSQSLNGQLIQQVLREALTSGLKT